MRRSLALALALLMLFSLFAAVGCGGKSEPVSSSGSGKSEPAAPSGSGKKPPADGNWTVREGYKKDGVGISALPGTSLIKLSEGREYYLANYKGEKLLDGKSFRFISNEDYGYIELTAKTGEVGLADAKGKLAVPLRYGAVEVLSEHVVLGIMLRKANPGERKEYFELGGEGGEYVHADVDIYYDGVKVVTLPEREYSVGYRHYNEQYGKYFSIVDPTGKAVWFNSKGQKTGAVTSPRDDEFEETVHTPTGISAFTAGCTLKEDETDIHYYYDKKSGSVLNLTGKVMFTLSEADRENYRYADVYYAGNGVCFRNSNKCSFYDWKGNKTMEVANGEETVYIAKMGDSVYVLYTDTKVAFADMAAGKVTWQDIPEGYELYSTGYENYCILKNNDDGKKQMLCTPAGTVDLGEYTTSWSDMGPDLLAVKHRDTHEGKLIDLKGKTILDGCEALSTNEDFCIKNDQVFTLE